MVVYVKRLFQAGGECRAIYRGLENTYVVDKVAQSNVIAYPRHQEGETPSNLKSQQKNLVVRLIYKRYIPNTFSREQFLD